MRIIIAAGGTGGHIFPALSIADQLRAEGVALWIDTGKVRFERATGEIFLRYPSHTA